MGRKSKKIPISEEDKQASVENEQAQSEDGDTDRAEEKPAEKQSGVEQGQKEFDESGREGLEKDVAGEDDDYSAVRQDFDQLQNRFLRLQADFDNYRKRMVREKGETYQRANEDLLLELLPAIDHLDLALDAAEEHDAPQGFIEGFRLVSEQLLQVLGKFGLSVIDAEGKEFDVNLHEAVSHLPSEDVPENRVSSQVRRGYMLGDRLLRPAQVVVSSGAPSAASGEAGEAE